MDANPAGVGIPERAEGSPQAAPAAMGESVTPEQSRQDVPIGPDAPVLGIMSTTRAMRHLSPEPVPDELIRTLVEAATWAPTGSNAQGEAFVVVTDRATIARLASLWRRVTDEFRMLMSAAVPGRAVTPAQVRIRDSVDYQRDHFAETPVIVVACYDQRDVTRADRNPIRVAAAVAPKVGLRRTARLFRAWPTVAQRSEAASIYPAVENLLLAARAHGLGACLTTWHLLAEAEFKEILGIPSGVETFAVIPIGWPLGHFGPVRRGPVEDVIHHDRW